ncbi:MAG: hypothetical protein JJE10_01525 [Thermoleophilia bacterium]|nr:hypothetical protein [Thermoleophilia bacterium]
MALTEDSRVLLQLLLGRGKSYGDISGLLGVDREEVRRRAHDALTEINGSDPDRDANLTDYLLGQADPIERADVARRIADDPQTADTASSLADQLRLLVPDADLPRQVSGGGSAGKAASRRSRSGSGSGSGKSSEGSRPSRSFTGSLEAPQRRLIALILAAGLLVVVLILLVTGVFGGGDDSGNGTEPAPTTAVLKPVSDETGRGKVVFGFSGANLAANIDLTELQPTGEGESYALWLFGSAGAFPINQSQVDDSGTITGQIQLNEAVICLIAADVFPEMRLSRVDDAELERLIRQSQQANNGNGEVPRYSGATVMKGLISMPQDAKEQIVNTCTAAGSTGQ